jgi:hypothetical protein
MAGCRIGLEQKLLTAKFAKESRKVREEIQINPLRESALVFIFLALFFRFSRVRKWIPVEVVNAVLLARSGGTAGKGAVTPITASGPEGRPCRTSPFMPFRDLSGKR